VIAGENDAAAPLPAAQALAGAIPGARLSVLPGAPHMMQIETADAYAAEVLDFLAEQRAVSVAAAAARRE
jgi:pimeloyl-ACP methyl ester carboxylesterase